MQTTTTNKKNGLMFERRFDVCAKKLRGLAFAPAEVRSAYAFASAVATSVGYFSCQSTVEGGTDPLGTCSRSRGGGTINRGGTLNRTKIDGSLLTVLDVPHVSRLVYVSTVYSLSSFLGDRFVFCDGTVVRCSLLRTIEK